MEYVVGEIGVGVCEGATHVVVFATAGLNNLFEFRDNFIIAAVSGKVHAGQVVDFLPAVQAENHIAHFAVGEIDNIIIDENAVCCQSKSEILAVYLFLLSGICHELFYNIPVHKGLTAKEVHFKIPAAAGILDEEVQCAFSDFKTHERLIPMVFSLTCEAVGAVEIAGVGNMEAERLDDIA